MFISCTSFSNGIHTFHLVSRILRFPSSAGFLSPFSDVIFLTVTDSQSAFQSKERDTSADISHHIDRKLLLLTLCLSRGTDMTSPPKDISSC